MVVIVVMLVGLLTFIICSELSYDDKNEEIFRDFFRFSEKSTHIQTTLLLPSNNFSLSIMFLRQVGKNASIVIFGLFTETITIQKSSVLNSKLTATR